MSGRNRLPVGAGLVGARPDEGESDDCIAAAVWTSPDGIVTLSRSDTARSVMLTVVICGLTPVERDRAGEVLSGVAAGLWLKFVPAEQTPPAKAKAPARPARAIARRAGGRRGRAEIGPQRAA